MRFGVLGVLEVHTDRGDEVRVPELKVRALLAILLAADREVVSADRLIEELWPGRRPADPRTALQARVSQLRRALGDAEDGGRDLVASRGAGYVLAAAPGAVDTDRVADLLRDARAGVVDAGRRARLLDDARALWRGPAFSDAPDMPGLRPAVTRLDRLRLDVLEERAEAHLATGEPPVELVGELEALTAEHPLRERARAALMRALYRSGRPNDALDAYRDLATRLRDELGTDPAPDLAALQRAVLDHDADALGGPAPDAARSGPPAGSGLPVALTGLVGREADSARVGRALAAGRLVTLVGTGGVGKTRLALAAAGAAAGGYADGVRLAELDRLPAGVEDAEVGAALAAACGVASGPASGPSGGRAPGAGAPIDPVSRLAAGLASRDMLLVVDNVEHVIGAAGRVVGRVLAAAPGLTVLATGREALEAPGEAVVPVEPLDVDGEPSPAVRLFTARAREADPVVELDAPTVAAICRRLDGVPLALELAAARLRALGPEGVLARLDDRLSLLGRGRGYGGPARHRTLRATLDWSWELLDDVERTALRRLAPCVGGCTLAAAEVMLDLPRAGRGEGADAVEVLARLVERSWLTASGHGAGRRFRMLESVAAYTAERLADSGEGRAVRDRHLAVFGALAERADAGLRGREQRSWLEALDAETANLRAAADHAVATGSAAAALGLAESTAWYWYLRGRLDVGIRLADAALAVPAHDGDTPSPACRAAVRAWRTGLVDTAHHPDVTAIAEHVDAPPRARWFVRWARWGLDDPPTVIAAFTDLTGVFRAEGDRWGAAAALVGRAAMAYSVDDLDGAVRDAERAEALFDEIGDRWGGLQAAWTLGTVEAARGDLDRAQGRFVDALRVADDLGIPGEVAGQHAALGRLALALGDLAAADHHHDRVLALGHEQGNPGLVGFARFGQALIARRRGDLDTAEVMLTDWMRGRRDGGGEVFLALPLAELGFVAELRGDAALALARQREGHEEAVRSGSPRAVALALEGVAGARSLAGGTTAAGRLLGAADRMRRDLGAPPGPGERADVDRIRDRLRAAIGDAALAEAEAEGAAAPDAGALVPAP